MTTNPVELALLNDFQHGLPLCPRPFAAMAEQLDVTEESVHRMISALLAQGKISRVGAVFRPRTIGASTLAALAVPESRIEQVAAMVNAHPEINHNYAREHAWNLWFVAAAPDLARLARVLDDIEARAACPLIRLPLVEDYHIDLGFDLHLRGRPETRRAARPPAQPVALTAEETVLVAALEDGLAPVARPYAELAARAGTSEARVLATLDHWVRDGVIARMGIIVRHHELGFDANAMAVWDVPDAVVDTIGRRMASADGVTLCYRRRRDLPHWRYNLYCMIHGRSRDRVLEQIGSLREATSGLTSCPHEVLFSGRRFMQRGARYTLQTEPVHG